MLVLIVCYVLFGRSWEKSWGLDPGAETPAYDKFDRKDYVSAAPGILLGHHVASIAGALVVFAPVLVQGDGAPPQLVEALRLMVIREKGANQLTSNDIPALVDDDLPQQAIVSAFRKYRK